MTRYLKTILREDVGVINKKILDSILNDTSLYNKYMTNMKD